MFVIESKKDSFISCKTEVLFNYFLNDSFRRFVYEITVTQKHIYVCFDDLEILVFFSCEIIPPPHHHYSSNKNVI